MNRKTLAAAAIAAAAITVTASCGGHSGPPQVLLHGIVSNAGICHKPIPPIMAPRAVVDIVSPSGTELAQVTVNQVTASHTARCGVPFTVTVPRLRLYGVKVEGGVPPGTVWVKAGQHVTIPGTL
jgi:hypothetical protein